MKKLSNLNTTKKNSIFFITMIILAIIMGALFKYVENILGFGMSILLWGSIYILVAYFLRVLLKP